MVTRVMYAAINVAMCGAFAAGPVLGGEGVIQDPAWTIEIRPGEALTTARQPAGRKPTTAIAPQAHRAVLRMHLVSQEAPAPALEGPARPVEEAQPVVPQEVLGPVSDVTPCSAGVRMSYKEAYEQVAFSRAEYEANPAYRHEAALEIMFGQLRPTTVVKQNVPYFTRYPDFYGYPVFGYPGGARYNSLYPGLYNGIYNGFGNYGW